MASCINKLLLYLYSHRGGLKMFEESKKKPEEKKEPTTPTPAAESKEPTGVPTFPLLAQMSLPEGRTVAAPMTGGLWLRSASGLETFEEYLDFASGQVSTIDFKGTSDSPRMSGCILIPVRPDLFALIHRGQNAIILKVTAPGCVTQVDTFKLPDTLTKSIPEGHLGGKFYNFQIFGGRYIIFYRRFSPDLIIVDTMNNKASFTLTIPSRPIASFTRDKNNNFIVISGRGKNRRCDYFTVDYTDGTARQEPISLPSDQYEFIHHLKDNIFLLGERNENRYALHLGEMSHDAFTLLEKIVLDSGLVDLDEESLVVLPSGDFVHADCGHDIIRLFDLQNKKMYSYPCVDTVESAFLYDAGLVGIRTGNNREINFLIAPKFSSLAYANHPIFRALKDVLTVDMAGIVVSNLSDIIPTGLSQLSSPLPNVTGVNILRGEQNQAILALTEYWKTRIASDDLMQVIADQFEVIDNHLRILTENSPLVNELTYYRKFLLDLASIVEQPTVSAINKFYARVFYEASPGGVNATNRTYLQLILGKLEELPLIKQEREAIQIAADIEAEKDRKLIKTKAEIIKYSNYLKPTDLKVAEMISEKLYKQIDLKQIESLWVRQMSEWFQAAVRYQELHDQSKRSLWPFFSTPPESKELSLLKSIDGKLRETVWVDDFGGKPDLNKINSLLAELAAHPEFPDLFKKQIKQLMEDLAALPKKKTEEVLPKVGGEQKRNLRNP